MDDINRVLADEALELPEDLDYFGAAELKSLGTEAASKLAASRPATLGAASRIQGVPPSALLLLMRHIRKKKTVAEARL